MQLDWTSSLSLVLTAFYQLYSLCRDEDEEEGEQGNSKHGTGNDRDEEEEMAAQNVDNMQM